MPSPSSAHPRGPRSAAAVLAVLLSVVPSVLAAAAPSAAAPAPAVSAGTGCTVSATLVNSCRPWLGAVADRYPGPATWRDQVLAHEQRIGRRVDVVHSYHTASAVTLSADERYFVDRGSILYLNWRPADAWRAAAGGDAVVDGRIDQMASSIRAVAPARVMLALFGEPERFVTPGTSSCPNLKGSAGSPADYRAMWQHVRDRFAAAGTTNVVWVMNYLGYVGWDCLFGELWPGNALVDWIVWDPYVGPNERWDDIVGYFYGALTAKADAAHAYPSKAWGLAEFGYWYGTDQREAYRMYDEAKASLDAGRYPRLKLYEPFDTVSGTGVDTRTSYTTSGVFDQTEQDHYTALARDPLLMPAGDVVDHLAGCDPTVETSWACFSGTYAAPVAPFWQAGDGHGGTHSVQVTNTTAAAGSFGLNAKPAPVGATAAGRTYSGAAWVRAGRTGQALTLLLRERRPDGSAPASGYAAASWTSTDTGWHRLAASYTAKEDGNTLTFSVYGPGLPAGAWLRADDFALTSSSG